MVAAQERKGGIPLKPVALYEHIGGEVEQFVGWRCCVAHPVERLLCDCFGESAGEGVASPEHATTVAD